MYYILIKNYYYAGTYGAPKDGALEDEFGVMTFKPKKDAEKYLTDRSCYNYAGSKWTWDSSKGLYRCSHGEYDAHDYWILKVRS